MESAKVGDARGEGTNVIGNAPLTAGLPFGNRMVLQRQKEIQLWGSGQPGRSITARFGSEVVGRAMVSADGSWSTILPPQEAARGLRLVVSDEYEQIEFNDVAIGEVWIAGGQSNMEYFLAFDAERRAVLNGSMNPDIRFFDCPRTSYEGQLAEKDFSRFGLWRSCTREDLPYFSAVAYYFAAELQSSLGVPVGVVGCNWGGTAASAWMSEEMLAGAEGGVWLEEYRAGIAELDVERYAAGFRAEPLNHMTDPLKKSVLSLLLSPGFPRLAQKALLAVVGRQMKNMVVGPMHPWRPTGLYDTMLRCIAPYTARGVIWYQGESDAPHADIYARVFGAMIHGWRALWGDDLPFLFVQLAPFGEWMGSTGEAFPELRRQQQLVADTIPGTWMASSSDAGMKWDIHPKHKRPIGRRLALLARRHLYGQKVLADPPEFLSAERTADGIEIRLRVAGDLSLGRGRVPVEVRSPSGDVIAPTGIRVDGDRLLLAGSFPSGSTVRFAWSAYYRVNVVDAAGNPATPFLIRV